MDRNISTTVVVLTIATVVLHEEREGKREGEGEKRKEKERKRKREKTEEKKGKRKKERRKYPSKKDSEGFPFLSTFLFVHVRGRGTTNLRSTRTPPSRGRNGSERTRRLRRGTSPHVRSDPDFTGEGVGVPMSREEEVLQKHVRGVRALREPRKS